MLQIPGFVFGLEGAQRNIADFGEDDAIGVLLVGFLQGVAVTGDQQAFGVFEGDAFGEVDLVAGEGDEAEAAERRDNQQRLREARQQKQAALDALERERDRRRRDAVERKRRAVEEKRRHEARERAALEQQRRGMILAKRFRADRVALLLARVVRVWGSYACSSAHRRRQADRRGRRLRERFLRATPFRRWAAFTRNARRERHAFAQERLLTKPFRAWAAWVASKRMVLMSPRSARFRVANVSRGMSLSMRTLFIKSSRCKSLCAALVLAQGWWL